MSNPAVAAGGLYYTSEIQRQVVVERLDLTTGQRTRVYGKRSSRYMLETLRAGGGRVALEIDSKGGRRIKSWVIALDPAGGPPRTLARASLRGPSLCGTQVSLEDVSQQGDVLVDEEKLGCGARRPDLHTMRRYQAAGPPAVVTRRRERNADEDPDWRLAGSWLLEVAESSLRVRDLANRAGRIIRPTRRRGVLSLSDVDAKGNVAVGEASFGRRSFHEVLRLVAPAVPLAAGRVLFDDSQVLSEPRFCGDRLVVNRGSGGRTELVAFDDLAGPPRSLLPSPHQGVASFGSNLACDADTAALVDDRGRRGTFIQVVPLAP